MNDTTSAVIDLIDACRGLLAAKQHDASLTADQQQTDGITGDAWTRLLDSAAGLGLFPAGEITALAEAVDVFSPPIGRVA